MHTTVKTPLAYIRLDLDNELEAGCVDARYPVRDFLDQSELYIDSYLDVCMPHMSKYLAMGDHACWPVSGGFVIMADGAVVMDETDELAFHTESWLPAIIALLRGSTEERVFAWQGSSMTLRRHSDFIELEDKNELGTACEPTRFHFHAFVEAMLDAAKELTLFSKEIRQKIGALLAEMDQPENALKVACLERLAGQFSDTWIESIAEIENLLNAQE